MSETSATDSSHPPLIEHAGELLTGYDVLFCDVWGVVHNGRTAYVDGCAALHRFRERGGTVVLVSNAPRTAPVVANVLASKDVPENCWDAIISSGDLARNHSAEQGFAKVHHIGPERDLDVFENSGLTRVSLDEAKAIFCTGLVHDRRETGEDYRPRLETAIARALPFVCANPDLVVDVGGDLLPCAGAIAKVFEDMGGDVFWAGKPYAPAYAAATDKASKLRGGEVKKQRILAIGDSVRTDIAGASAFGIDALFIGQGIHREMIMPSGQIVKPALAKLFAGQPPAVAAMASLRW